MFQHLRRYSNTVPIKSTLEEFNTLKEALRGSYADQLFVVKTITAITGGMGAIMLGAHQWLVGRQLDARELAYKASLGALEERMVKRMDASEERMDASVERMVKRMDASEERLGKRIESLIDELIKKG